MCLSWWAWIYYAVLRCYLDVKKMILDLRLLSVLISTTSILFVCGTIHWLILFRNLFLSFPHTVYESILISFLLETLSCVFILSIFFRRITFVVIYLREILPSILAVEYFTWYYPRNLVFSIKTFITFHTQLTCIKRWFPTRYNTIEWDKETRVR